MPADATREGSDRPRVRLGRIAIVLVLLAPLLLAGTLVWHRSSEDAALRSAAEHLEYGRWEHARAEIGGAIRRPFLSGEARRQAAGLLLRLGEDQRAHELIRGLKPDPNDPADRRLRALAADAQRAAALVARADRTQDRAQRVRLLQEARSHLPEAANVLRRLGEAALGAYIQTRRAEYNELFLESYAALARSAPSEAARMKQGIAAQLGSPPPSARLDGVR